MAYRIVKSKKQVSQDDVVNKLRETLDQNKELIEKTGTPDQTTVAEYIANQFYHYTGIHTTLDEFIRALTQLGYRWDESRQRYIKMLE